MIDRKLTVQFCHNVFQRAAAYSVFCPHAGSSLECQRSARSCAEFRYALLFRGLSCEAGWTDQSHKVTGADLDFSAETRTRQRIVFSDFGMALQYAKTVNDLLKAAYDVLESELILLILGVVKT